jgi:hypothetical protein
MKNIYLKIILFLFQYGYFCRNEKKRENKKKNKIFSFLNQIEKELTTTIMMIIHDDDDSNKNKL